MFRKSLLLSLVFCLFAAFLVFPSAANPFGDVNGDWAVGADDARLALRRSVDLETFDADSSAYIAADYNRDGSVGADDARAILRLSVGIADAYAFHVPMVAVDSLSLRATLTDVRQKYYEMYDAQMVVYTFRIRNKTDRPLYVYVDSVTVNGYHLGDDEMYEAPIPVNGEGMREVLFEADIFKDPTLAQGKVEELLFRFVYYKEDADETYFVPVSLYPTNLAPGQVVYLPDDSDGLVQEENDILAFGMRGEDWDYTDHPEFGTCLNYYYAAFRYLNKTDRCVDVVLDDIYLDDLSFPFAQGVFVFPHTVATPVLDMDPNFFYEHGVYDFSRVSFTLTVYDNETGEVLFQDAYVISYE